MAVDLGSTPLFAIANLDDQIVVPSEGVDHPVLEGDLGVPPVSDLRLKDLPDQGPPEDVHLLAVLESGIL